MRELAMCLSCRICRCMMPDCDTVKAVGCGEFLNIRIMHSVSKMHLVIIIINTVP